MDDIQQNTMRKLIIVVAYRPHKSTNKKSSETMYQQQRIHVRKMVEYQCRLKLYNKDLCDKLNNWKDQGESIKFSINQNK